jgi:hypothetical protein
MAVGPVFAGAGGGGTGGSTSTPTPTTSTTTSTSTTIIDRGTINAGTIYQGSVTVSGAMSATVLYAWGNLTASSAILASLQSSVGGTAQAAVNFFRNAVASLPSNYELLTATVGPSSNFLYYDGSASGFQLASDITDGSNALGIELEVVGGRTASYTQTVSGPSNFTYALSETTSETHTSSQTVRAGDVVLATVDNVDTAITTYKGNANVSIYQVDGQKFVSPIVLDLRGQGRLEASSGNWLPHPGRLYKDRLMTFDFNANGFEELMEWVGPDDGLLVEPKANGSIDGSCLFGTTGGWTNGFEKLSLRDANHDGELSGDELAGLSVWQDRNGNGKADYGEVRTLADWRITQISLMHSNYRSTFTMNGGSHVMWDWWPSALHVRKVRVADIETSRTR